MLKFIISISLLTTVIACNNAGDNVVSFETDDRNGKITTSGSSISSMNNSEELTAVLREHANYGKLFRSIMESIDETCDIFYDYFSDADYNAISFAESGSSHLFDSNNDNSYESY